MRPGQAWISSPMRSRRACGGSVFLCDTSGPERAAQSRRQSARRGGNPQQRARITLLHPALFFQSYARAWRGIARSGLLAEPWSAETRFSRVDYRDVAETAAIALTEDRLLYGTFELCAEGWLNRHDVAALASEVLGRRVRVERTDPDTLGDEAGPMRPMFEHYDHTGPRGNALTLRMILGREPRTLRTFFDEMNGTPDAAAPGERG